MYIMIKRFDVSSLNERSNIVILNATKYEKDTLIKKIVSNRKHGFIYKESDDNPTQLEQIRFNEDIDKILDLRFHKQKKDPFICCFYDKVNLKQPRVLGTLFNGRHYNHLNIFSFDSIYLLPQNARGNMGYVFIFKEQLLLSRKKIFEHYGAKFDTFKIFCECFDACTHDWYCIVLGHRQNEIFYYEVVPRKELYVILNSQQFLIKDLNNIVLNYL